MPIRDASGAASLLPYLNMSAPGLGLELIFTDSQSGLFEHTRPEPCGPFTGWRSGRIVFDGRQSVASVMVLSQSDAYEVMSSELGPVTNLDVDETWQSAWRQIEARSGTGLQEKCQEPVALPAQLDDNGTLRPLRPLFYCRHVKRYSHVLCPFCGGSLDLCRDDTRLESAGLPGYSGSLERFLYCPACHEASPQAPFYQHPLAAEASAGVQGCHQLIEDFSRLLARAELAPELPCVGCGEAARCYGEQMLALQRMSPVQFYPFHMLLQKAPSVNAVDFIALLGGASCREIEEDLVRSQLFGRHHLLNLSAGGRTDDRGFLFAGDQRFFSEVLYLKLSFLAELWALVSDGAQGPVNRMTMEGVGVNIPVQGTRLPYLWDFSLRLIDPVGWPVVLSVRPDTSRAMALEFFARSFFYVLLVNERQPVDMVFEALGRLQLREPSMKINSPPIDDPVFAPGNIFRHPGSIEPEPPLRELWEETLAFGAQLMAGGAPAPDADGLSTIERELAELKLQARQSLFQTGSAYPLSGDDTAPDTEADEHIARILEGLLNQPAPAPQDEHPPVNAAGVRNQGAQLNEDGDYEETIILSTPTPAEEVDTSIAGNPEPDLDKTVVLTHAGLGGDEADPEKTVTIAPRTQSTAGDDLEKTVAIKKPAQSPVEENLEKTVVISPTPSREPGFDPDKTVVIGAQGPSEEKDELAETIVQSPAGVRPPRPPRPPAPGFSPKSDEEPSREDDLEATIVQPHKGAKDRKPKP